MEELLDDFKTLVGISLLLFLSFLFSVISVATGGWTNLFDKNLLGQYNVAAGRDDLWLVGCAVLIILGIICLCISALIVMSRFFNKGRGRALLGGVLCCFTGCIYIIALGIFIGQVERQRNELIDLAAENGIPYVDSVRYGYSFALLWVAVPISVVAGILMALLKDSEFLKSELEYSSASKPTVVE